MSGHITGDLVATIRPDDPDWPTWVAVAGPMDCDGRRGSAPHPTDLRSVGLHSGGPGGAVLELFVVCQTCGVPRRWWMPLEPDRFDAATEAWGREHLRPQQLPMFGGPAA